MPNLTIVIPTFNEAETIKKTIIDIDYILKRTSITFEILVVDDNSPDGTARIVKEMVDQKIPVRVHVRNGHPGLSDSVIEGFDLAEGKIICVTDSDGSHQIDKIPEMYKICAAGTDIVIGSRYCKGGKIDDWPLKRRVISFVATSLARLLFPNLTDPVSGFFVIKKDLVEYACLKPRGYKILLEVIGKTYWHTVKEIPYTFTNRKNGESKLRTGTMVEYLIQLIDIARTPGRQREEIERVVKFCIVGASGVFVNVIALGFFKEWIRFPLIGASFLAIELSIISNFLLNDTWSFKEIKTEKSWLHRMFSYNMISVGSMIVNIMVLVSLSSFGVYYMIANVIGILIGLIWNFIMNRRITWGENSPKF